MTDFQCTVSHLRRPRLLIRAARFGLADYRRDRDLRRLIGRTAPPEIALKHLLDEECRTEGERQNGEATYSVSRHIELLIALVAEARLAQRPS